MRPYQQAGSKFASLRSRGVLSPVSPKKEPTAPRVSRKARQLALAYYIERLVEAGELEGYAEAARLLGVSRARMSQIIDLLGMPVAEQERAASAGSARTS